MDIDSHTYDENKLEDPSVEIEIMDEKEIQCHNVMKQEMRLHAEHTLCQCRDHYLAVMIVQPIVLNGVNYGFTYKCNDCKNTWKLSPETGPLEMIFCPNESIVQEHPNGLYICMDCWLKRMRSEQILLWKIIEN